MFSYLKSALKYSIVVHSVFLCASPNLDTLIPAKVVESRLYAALYLLAKNEPLKTILEIGASSGDGSTEPLVLGAIQSMHRPTIFCIEISKPRFRMLQYRYQHIPLVKCYNVSSIPLERFPTENELLSFLLDNTEKFDMEEWDHLVQCYKQDFEYAQRADVRADGIELIKKENNIEQFDMVFIDGSDFTSTIELKLIHGARFIILDDIHAFKNFANYHCLMNDPSYENIEQDDEFRNGYAVFKKRDNS